MTRPILYLAPSLPSLSETFVYNELIALRARGVDVRAASVHAPGRDLGDPCLEQLAEEAIPVYGLGPVRLLSAALAESLRHPLRTASNGATALRDALFSTDVRGLRRLKVIWQMLAALALARRVRPLRPGHIHAHLAHVPTTVAMYAARQFGITFSFTGHANDLFPERALLPEKLRRARFVACISTWHREFYRSLVDLPDQRLPIVRCGVAIPDPRPKQPTATPALVAVGRLIPKKGFDVLARALAQLAREGRDMTCRIIGGGPQQAELERLVRELKLGERLQLLGPRSNSEVKQLLAQADLFVLPCRIDSTGDRDGIPVVLMEALAAEVCVISGDLPTIRELVQHDRTGLMVPPGDVSALADAIRVLVDDPARRQRLAAAGRAWVRAEFSTETNVNRLMAAFDGCASGEPAVKPPDAGNRMSACELPRDPLECT